MPTAKEVYDWMQEKDGIPSKSVYEASIFFGLTIKEVQEMYKEAHSESSSSVH